MQSIDFGLAANWMLGPNELDAAEHLVHLHCTDDSGTRARKEVKVTRPAEDAEAVSKEGGPQKKNTPQTKADNRIFRAPDVVERTYIFALSAGRILRLLIVVAIVWLVFGKSTVWSITLTLVFALVGCVYAVWGSIQSWKRFQVRFALIQETAETHRDVIRYFQEEDRDKRRSTRDILQSLCTVVFAGVLGRMLTSRRFDWLQSLGSKRMFAVDAAQDMLNQSNSSAQDQGRGPASVTSPPVVIAVS
jgi:hypothetical protein